MDESNPEATSPGTVPTVPQGAVPTVPALPAVPAYVPATVPRPPKSPMLALALSILFPGMGQVYNGQLSKAIFIFAAFVGSIYGAAEGAPIPFAFCIPFVLFLNYIDAWRTAAIINERAAGGVPPPEEETLESPIWGASLVAMGLLLLLNNLGWLRLSVLAPYWPLVLIVAGGVFLYQALNRRRDGRTPPADRDAFLS